MLQSVTMKGRRVVGGTLLLPFNFGNMSGGAKEINGYILTALVSCGVEKGEVGNDAYKLES